MKLSDQAWERSSKIIAEIKSHPFNQALMKGELQLDKFSYYIEQDSLYLREFARCHAMIAARIAPEYMRVFCCTLKVH